MPTLQSSGAISINDINAEFALGNNLNAYRGVTWYTDAGGSGTFSSGAISMNEFYSKRKTAPGGTFTPAGSTSSGSRTVVSGYAYASTASVTITCTQSATWTYSRTSGTVGGANVTSGNSATSITFSMAAGSAVFRYSAWTLDATSGSNTRYFEIQLTTENEGNCPTCCFTPDTLITMADGSEKPISEVSVGDFILVYDELSQFNVAVPVSEIITREERPMYELTFANGNSLRASEDHPLYVVGKGYASVAPIPDYKDLGLPNRLEVGDQVVNELGVPSRIVEIKPIEYTGTVYTFGNSRFYANGVLVY
jgi:hypothetical protein